MSWDITHLFCQKTHSVGRIGTAKTRPSAFLFSYTPCLQTSAPCCCLSRQFLLLPPPLRLESKSPTGSARSPSNLPPWAGCPHLSSVSSCCTYVQLCSSLFKGAKLPSVNSSSLSATQQETKAQKYSIYWLSKNLSGRWVCLCMRGDSKIIEPEKITLSLWGARLWNPCKLSFYDVCNMFQSIFIVACGLTKHFYL